MSGTFFFFVVCLEWNEHAFLSFSNFLFIIDTWQKIFRKEKAIKHFCAVLFRLSFTSQATVFDFTENLLELCIMPYMFTSRGVVAAPCRFS